jgi:hypothetical protein
MLIVVLFIPFGVYHSMTEPYVAVALWGFLLPVGYVAAASGVAVILYPTATLLKGIRFWLSSHAHRLFHVAFPLGVS